MVKKLKYIILLATALVVSHVVFAQSDIEIIKERLTQDLLDLEVDDSKVSTLINTIKSDGSWPEINYVDVRSTAYEHRFHLENLFELSKAFQNESSRFFKSEDLKNTFHLGIDFWIKNDFIANNWHTNEIRNPGVIVDILLLMQQELSEKQLRDLEELASRANFNCWGARPGGDQIKIAGIAAEQAAFLGDDLTLKKAIEIMANEVQISSGNGIKPDMGFHHRVDRVTSILSYGRGYADAFINWAYRLRGTKYQYPEESIHLITDFYLDGICKSMVHGKFKDPGVMNRGISRKGHIETFDADIPEKLALVSTYRRDELRNIVDIRKGEQASNLTSNKFFWHSEYLSHQRSGFHATVRMHSERQRNIEYPHNMESLKMHHYTDGALFVSRKGTEFYDIFPVWDWQKIPGTTVVQKDSLPSYREIVKWGKTDFVGAVTDGEYGVVTFDFSSPHDDLKARKSWFFFDNEIVCLGAGIVSKSGNHVSTTLNQCLLEGDVVVRTEKKRTKLKKGDHKIEKVSWIYHDSIAYFFSSPEAVFISNKNFTGNWKDITEQARFKNERENKELFSCWIDHGENPTNGKYEYIVLPATGKKDVDEFQNKPPIRILENSKNIQAVENIDLGIAQIVFYEPGTIEFSNGIKVSVNQPGIAMLKTTSDKIEKISVADPTRKLVEFHIEMSPGFFGKNELTIPLPQNGEAGKSVVLNNSKDLEKLLATEPAQKAQFESPRTDGKHYIGEKYGGGVIVWLDEKREHGLIAALEDSRMHLPWENGQARITEHYGDRNDRITNAQRDGIGAGQLNTSLIISQQTDDRFFGEFAAKEAIKCTLGGYGDWYLPSKFELGILYDLKDEIGGFEGINYWSSTEYNVGFAWGMGFKHYKSEYTFNKGTNCAVRCIRKF